MFHEYKVIDKIRLAFKVGKEDSITFQYCGIDLAEQDGCILLSQDQYADRLNAIDIGSDRALEKDADLTEVERTTLRSKVGQLMWLAHQSRPDILFDVTTIAVGIKRATVKDLLSANKVVNKARSSKLSITFQHLGPDNDLSLMVFTDAALGNLPEGGSQGGHLILLVGKSGRFSPIWWTLRKIRRVVKSTLAAETLAKAEGIDMAVYVSTLYTELTEAKIGCTQLPLICVLDCKSLYEALHSSKSVSEKRLRIEMSSIKELIDNGQIIEVRWSVSGKQLADCLTKRGASSTVLRQTLLQGTL